MPSPPVTASEVRATEFTFGLPPGWRPASPNELHQASYQDAGGQALMVAGAYGPGYDGYWCNLTVGRLDWALDPAWMQHIQAGGLIQIRVQQGWRPLSPPRWMSVGGTQAHAMSYTMLAMGQLLEGTELIVPRPATVYRVLFSTRAQVHNLHWPDLMTVLQTWVWLA